MHSVRTLTTTQIALARLGYSGATRARRGTGLPDLRELCDYADAHAKRRRLHLTLENFDREIEKKRLIGPTVEAAALAMAIERENFGLTIDLSHLPLIRETPAEALHAAGPHLIHAHIGNCVIDYPQSSLYGDFHPRFGHPEGCNDVPQVVEFLRELHAVGYWEQARHRLNTTPILSIEVRPTDGDTSETILANGKRTSIRAWEIVSRQPEAAELTQPTGNEGDHLDADHSCGVGPCRERTVGRAAVG